MTPFVCGGCGLFTDGRIFHLLAYHGTAAVLLPPNARNSRQKRLPLTMPRISLEGRFPSHVFYNPPQSLKEHATMCNTSPNVDNLPRLEWAFRVAA